MIIDIADKKYQKTEEFKPDKESTWHYPKEKDGKSEPTTSSLKL